MAGKPKAKATPDYVIPDAEPVRTSRDPESGLFYGRDQYGNIYRVSQKDFEQGAYEPVDPDTADKVGKYRKELDNLSPLSLGYSVARGLSGRLVDIPMASLTSPEEMKHYTDLIEEKYPTGATLAEALGMVAPLVVSGGTAGAARLATAPGLFEAAGSLAGRGIAGAAERGMLSEGARWATEGALWGASHDISRQTLEGKPLDWDKVWDATSGSALFAGVLGGGFGAVAGRFGRARGAAADGAADIAAKGTPEEAATAAKAVYGPEAHPGIPDLMAEIGQPGKASAELIGRARRDPNVAKLALADEAEATLQSHALKVTEQLSDAKSIVDDYPVFAGGKRKMTQYRQALEGVDPVMAEQATLTKLQEIANEARAIGDSAQLVDKRGAARRVAEYTEARIARLEELRGTQHYTAELASELENLKRFMQAESSKAGGHVAGWDDFKEFMFRNGEPANEGSLAHMLQDPRLWGERAASMNEEINAAVHKQLYRSQVVNDAFGMKLGAPDPQNPYRMAIGIDAEKVANFLNKLDSPLKSREFQILKDYARGADELGQTMRKYYEMTPEQSSRLAKWEKSAAELDSVLEKAKDDVSVINQFKKIGVGDPHTEARIMGFAAGGLIGHMGAGPAGALAGGAAGSYIASMLNPMQKIRTAAAIRRRINAYDGWKARAIDRLAGTKWASKSFETHAFPEIVAKDESPRKLAAAARALLYGAFREQGDDDVRAMERQIEHVAAATPGKIREGVKAWFGPAAQEYPAAVDHMVGKIQRAQQVLLEQRPLHSEPDGMGFAGWFRMPPDESDLRRFEEIWTAVLQPRAVLSMANADELSPDTVDVLNFVHPDLMVDFRETLRSSLADGTAPKSTERRRTLSILYGVPMDPTMEPEYIDLMQSMNEMRDQIQEEQEGQNQYRPRGTGGPSGVNISPRGDQLDQQEHPGAGAEG